MRKACFLAALAMGLLALGGCGKAEEEPEYYEIRVESRILEEAETGQTVLGRQYWQGEPVTLLGELVKTEDGGRVMDVYLQPAGKEKSLLMGGISQDYRSVGWYLDGDGGCYIAGRDGVVKLDGEGNMLYRSLTDGTVEDICGLGDGRLILLVRDSANYGLWRLDAATGKVSALDSVALDSGSQYIGGSGGRLLLLDQSGFWHVDLKKGTKTLELPFEGTDYRLPSGQRAEERAADFWAEGSEAGVIWNTGTEDKLTRVNIGEEREIITFRVLNLDRNHNTWEKWIKEQVQAFNQGNDEYYVVFEECGEGTAESDFRTETGLKLAAGKGADILCRNTLPGDEYDLIDNGIFMDLKPFMEASGMREEDYFPAAFDPWRYEGGIYGVNPYINCSALAMDQSLLGDGQEVDIEAILDIMLDPGGERSLLYWDGRDILDRYLLPGTEDLWGMVDWEEGTCDFKGGMFSQILQAAKRCASGGKEDQPKILQWQNQDTYYVFETTEDLAEKGCVKAGMLFGDGCHTALWVNELMGINAGSRHPEGAWRFLSFLLGEEAQSDKDFSSHYFPVHREAFDRAVQREIETGAVEIICNEFGVQTGVIYKGPPGTEDLTQEKADAIARELEDVRALPIRTQPLISIILEEADAYFSGEKSEAEVIDVVQNRVQLYLDERKKRK